MPFSSRSSRVAFDRFELDLRSGELRKDGRKIRLQAQPFQLLALLIEHVGEVVTREEVCRALWSSDTFVDFDHGVAVAVNKIREALGDDADNARFIETLPKRGYRFIAHVQEVVVPNTSPLPSNGAHNNGSYPENGASSAILPPTTTGQPREIPVHSNLAAPHSRLWLHLTIAAALLLALVVFFAARTRRKEVRLFAGYTQLTNFSDAVSSPAISPDGRMIAFIRGNGPVFPTAGEVYTMLFPNGQPVQLTHDGFPKYSVSFSPDGSQIAYTIAQNRWDTFTTSPLGGEPRLFLANAAGLTWLDARQLMFSQITTGLHMVLATSTDSRSQLRTIYSPEHERGMAHYSFLSPDRKRVLVVEMDGTGGWRCRLVPFDGSSMGYLVGPPVCTSAAWSPNGESMYFSAYVDGASHLWRQSLPDGHPQQITFGPTEEIGVAVMPDGHSLISSVGMNETGVWLHDARGERMLSSEGYAWQPKFSRDGSRVYFLLRRESSGSPQELWTTEIASGKSAPLVQGFSIDDYDISLNEKEIVFTTQPPGGKSQLWLASADHSFAPRMLASSGESTPFFGPDNDVIFIASEASNNYLFRINKDGSGRVKVLPSPIVGLKTISPDRLFAVVTVAVNEVPTTAVVAVPIHGGAIRRICPAEGMVKWSPDGSRFFVAPLLQGTKSGMTVSILVPKGKSLPDLPPDGIRSSEDAATLPQSSVVDLANIDSTRFGINLDPGIVDGTFVYVKTVTHRNLFQIPLP